MTNVKIFRNKNGDILKYEVSGHADYDDHGRDILCAAVSVLSQTTILALNKVCKINENDIEFCIDEKTGYLEVAISKGLKAEQRNNANIVLETMVVGLEDLATQYPKHISLMEKEEKQC